VVATHAEVLKDCTKSLSFDMRIRLLCSDHTRPMGNKHIKHIHSHVHLLQVSGAAPKLTETGTRKWEKSGQKKSGDGGKEEQKRQGK